MTTELRHGLQSLQGFSSLDEPVLSLLAAFASVRMIRAGETIFCQGEPSPYCFGILSGEVMIQHVSKDRRFAPKILGVLGQGSLFGESSIFEDSARRAMASASKDGKLIAIRGAALRDWMFKNAQASQPLLLALLQASTERLHRTSQELSVIYGVGRLLGSDQPFLERFSAALEFLKGSLQGLDDLVVYQRSASWNEFIPLMSFPVLQDLPAIPLQNELVQTVSSTGEAQVLLTRTLQTPLEAFNLPWQERMAVTVMPLFNWDIRKIRLQGLLCLASQHQPDAFSLEKLLLLTAISHPISEALSRLSRQEDPAAS